PAFARMRVEAGDGNLRLGYTEARAEVVLDDLRGLTDQPAGDEPRYIAERHVNGERHDAEVLVRQHHHRTRRGTAIGAEVGEELGVAGMAEAGLVEGGLVDRRGDDGAALAG